MKWFRPFIGRERAITLESSKRVLAPDRILLKLQSPKRTTAINEVAKLLENHPDVANFQGFYNELLARERLDTTCLGNEIRPALDAPMRSTPPAGMPAWPVKAGPPRPR